MAISFPISAPTVINPGRMKFRQRNVAVISRSPFTLKEQVLGQPGQAWELEVSLPNGIKRDVASEWVGFLASLQGAVGTFLIGDPNAASPRGSVSGTPTLTGTAGNSTATVVMTGTLLRGDYIQLGTGASAKLHQVTQDQSGSGSLEIWPELRSDYTAETVIYTNTVGRFRKSDPVMEYDINEALSYGISFSAIEALS